MVDNTSNSLIKGKTFYWVDEVQLIDLLTGSLWPQMFLSQSALKLSWKYSIDNF